MSDIVNHNGGLMSKAEIESNYNIKLNFLEYMRVHRCVNPREDREQDMGQYTHQMHWP